MDWIKVKNGVPDNKKLHLLYDEEGYIRLSNCGIEHPLGVPVIAWMPLPKPPPKEWMKEFKQEKRERNE